VTHVRVADDLEGRGAKRRIQAGLTFYSNVTFYLNATFYPNVTFYPNATFYLNATSLWQVRIRTGAYPTHGG
jgi:hypothetical protein